MTDKIELRTLLRKTQANLEPEYIESANFAIYSKLISLTEYKTAKNIFCYYSVRNEVNTHKIIEKIFLDGKRLFLPLVLVNGVMEAVEVKDMSNLAPGALGIPQPPFSGTRLRSSAGDLAVIPALAFDKKRYRLGQGGGYYDRFLKAWSGVTVGICYSRLLREKIPIEPHDIKVDILITEDNFYQ